MRLSRWAIGAISLAGLVVGGGCAIFSGHGKHLPVPDQIVFLFTGDTGGELKGCG